MTGAARVGRGIALRMDDIGAATKVWEVYAKRLPLPGPAGDAGNWLFLKYLPPLALWGPYRELRPDDWERILNALTRHSALLTVAITAAWVTWSGELIPFPERFPRQAELVRRGVVAGLLEVANHGLTHCVLAGHVFRPRLFAGNRTSHREFWDWVPAEVQEDHLRRSQEILRGWLGTEITTFVPPGNVFGAQTLRAAEKHGLRYLSCATTPRVDGGVTIIGNDGVIAFHDRDLVKGGTTWLERVIKKHVEQGASFKLVRQLGESVARRAD